MEFMITFYRFQNFWIADLLELSTIASRLSFNLDSHLEPAVPTSRKIVNVLRVLRALIKGPSGESDQIDGMSTEQSVTNMEPNYFGLPALIFISERLHLPLDMVHFLFWQLCALLLGYFMRKRVKNVATRLWYTLVCGIAICSFCYGTQIFHILISGGICYLIMNSTRSKFMPWLVFAASMGYLSLLHMKRQFYDDASCDLGIMGLFMVLTQKLTSLAFSFMDCVNSKKGDQELTPLQKQRLVGEIPSPLFFCSYIFQFQSMLAGPLVFFDDFAEFICSPVKEEEANPTVNVVIKLLKTVFFIVITLNFASMFDVYKLETPEILENSTGYLLLYILISTTLERCKYYHAWILADAVCNISGLGYDRSKGSWDKVTNVHAFRFESSLSLKELLDTWNIQTMKWLRFVVYDRAPVKWRIILVYIVNAFWHGFYPGDYITFLSAALFTTAGRAVRRYLRPYFLENTAIKFSYDVFTCIFTRFLISYITFAFVLQHFYPCVAIYMRLYFFLHISAIVSIYLLPLISKKQPASSENRNGVRASKSLDNESNIQNGAGNKASGSQEKDNPISDWKTRVMDAHDSTIVN